MKWCKNDLTAPIFLVCRVCELLQLLIKQSSFTQVSICLQMCSWNLQLRSISQNLTLLLLNKMMQTHFFWCSRIEFGLSKEEVFYPLTYLLLRHFLIAQNFQYFSELVILNLKLLILLLLEPLNLTHLIYKFGEIVVCFHGINWKYWRLKVN